MMFASSTTPQFVSAWAHLLRQVCVIALLGAAPTAQAGIVVLSSVDGISEGQAVEGKIDLRANILGKPDIVLFELTGPVDQFTARYGQRPSFKIDPQSGENVLWDTTHVPNGEYTLQVTAVDEHGNDRQHRVTFTVNNTLTNTEQEGIVEAMPPAENPSRNPGADRAPLPQIVVIDHHGNHAGPDTVLGDFRSAQTLPLVAFSDRPAVYTRGSGDTIEIALDGPMPSDGSIVAIAWNNDESRIIDAYAHTLDVDDPVLSTEYLDRLPAGNTELQLLVRRASQVHEIVRLKLEVRLPEVEAPTVPTVSFIDPPVAVQRGSAATIGVSLAGPLPEGGDVLVLAWSRAEQRMVSEFAFVLGDDLLIPAASLDELPGGFNQLQLLTRVDNVVHQRVGFMIQMQEPPAPEPEVVELPAVGFASAPGVYYLGSGLDLGLTLSGPMPAEGDVVAVAWSDSEQRMVERFAITLTGDSMRIPSERMEMLPVGDAEIQLLVRLDDQIQSITTHPLEVAPATPQVDPPQPEVGDRPAVAFRDTPERYSIGSGLNLALHTTGGFPDGSDLLVIAWSVDQSQLVDAFAFTTTQAPFQIPASRMDLLPAGEVILQLLPREDNKAYAQVVHRLTIVRSGDSGGGDVVLPTPDSGDGANPDAGTDTPTDGGTDDEGGGEEPQPETYGIAFAPGTPSQYQRGSGATVALSVSADLPAGSSVRVQAWSAELGSYVGSFDQTLSGAPWRVASSDLDQLADGAYRLDASLQVPGQPVVFARHAVTIRSGNTGQDVSPQTPLAGFTAYAPSSDTRVIYVAADGNDTNNGLSPLTAVRTLQRGAELMRDGKPDWLLLRRGDTFDLPADEGGDFRYWQPSGRSHDEPMIVGAYGDATSPRPQIHSNGRGALRSVRSSHLVFRDLHFNANRRDPHGPDFDGGEEMEAGVSINSTTDLRFEGCLVEYFSMNMMFRDGSNTDPTLSGIVLHRCVIRNAYAHGERDASGMYLKLADGITLSECIIDHNGWDEDVPESVRRGRNHNVYFSDCTNITVTGCIFSRESYLALKIRCEVAGHCRNVLVRDNLFLECAFPLDLGANGSDNAINFVNVTIEDNVFVRTTGWPLDEPRGRGMKLSRSSNARVTGNLFVDNGPNGPEKNEACRIDGETRLDDVMVFDNDAVLPLLEGEELFSTHYRQRNAHDDITFTNNRENAISTRYVDPTVSIDDYLDQIGCGSIDAFLSRAVAQDALNWNTDYMAARTLAYYRDGFELTLFD